MCFITLSHLRHTLARHPLSQTCYPLALGYYLEAHGHHMQWRAPNDHPLIYCRAGRGWSECVGERVEVGDGDLLVLPKGLEHTCGADPQRPWDIHWAYFEGPPVENFLRPLGNAPRLCLGMQSCLLAKFDALLALHRQGLSLSHFIHVVHLLQGLLTSLAARPARASLKSGRMLDIDAVQALMHMYLRDSLNLDKLTAQFKLSRFHFAKTYRALTDQAPVQDLIQMKMARACRLLDEDALGVRQIAEQPGYADPYYFSRLFRKVVGMAPNHYRALHQG